MFKRQSRTPRSEKARTPGTAPADLMSLAASTDPAVLQSQNDPTQTAQLRALEAGWDELLS